MLSLQRGLDFWSSGGRSWDQKAILNRSKNEVNMGRHLGIHFSLILVGLGGQVGRQNGAKIDAKRHRKNDVKKKGSMIAKKLEKVPANPSDRRGPGSRGSLSL